MVGIFTMAGFNYSRKTKQKWMSWFAPLFKTFVQHSVKPSKYIFKTL